MLAGASIFFYFYGDVGDFLLGLSSKLQLFIRDIKSWDVDQCGAPGAPKRGWLGRISEASPQGRTAEEKLDGSKLEQIGGWSLCVYTLHQYRKG